jgi:DNA-binding NarL/FixJ family response regulator
VVDTEVSPREADVLDALGDRLTNAEIAERLFLSVRTVEHHVSALLRKFGADNRRSLADVAQRRRTGDGSASESNRR